MKIVERYDYVRESSEFVLIDDMDNEHYLDSYNYDEHGSSARELAVGIIESVCKLNGWTYEYDEVDE